MYQVNTNKRYNVRVHYSGYNNEFQNVKLIALQYGLVIFEDRFGKEHIFTGGKTDIYISEV